MVRPEIGSIGEDNTHDAVDSRCRVDEKNETEAYRNWLFGSLDFKRAMGTVS